MPERNDGLTVKEELRIRRQVFNASKKEGGQAGMFDLGRMTRTGKSLTEDCVDFVEGVVNGSDYGVITRLAAVDLVLKMNQQNMMMQRISQDAGGSGEGQVIVLLPPNGTERKNDVDDNDDDDDLDGDSDRPEMAGD